MSTERVFMIWPVELKRRVRNMVGARGLSAFVIKAVEDKLQQVEADIAGDDPASGAGSAGDEPEPSPVETDEPSDPVDGQPAKFDARTAPARTAHVEQTYGLRRASELHPPPGSAAPTAEPEGSTTEEVNTSFCGTCQSPLIAGECWTCSI